MYQTITTGRPTERRLNPRFHAPISIPCRVALRDGVLIDLSTQGARVRHGGALKLGSEILFSFFCLGHRFAAMAHVETCAVAFLGNEETGATMFESRVVFNDLTHDAQELIERFLASVE